MFINLTCLDEARAATYSDSLTKKSQMFDKLRSKYAGSESMSALAGEELPSEVIAFKYYKVTLEKCLTQGLVAYLISDNCSDLTSDFVLETLGEHQINQLIDQCR